MPVTPTIFLIKSECFFYFKKCSSSGGLGLEVISQVSQKGKERLSGCLALCLSSQGEPPPLFVLLNYLICFLIELL
jgi:hypothetical protein